MLHRQLVAWGRAGLASAVQLYFSPPPIQASSTLMKVPVCQSKELLSTPVFELACFLDGRHLRPPRPGLRHEQQALSGPWKELGHR